MNQYALSTRLRPRRFSATRFLICLLSSAAIIGAIGINAYEKYFPQSTLVYETNNAKSVFAASDKDSLSMLKYYVENFSQDKSYNTPNESEENSAQEPSSPVPEAAQDNTNNSSGGIEPGHLKILSKDLSGNPGSKILLKNETGYSPDIQNLLQSSYPVSTSFQSSKASSSEENPVVLIIHTHGTEGYADEDAVSLNANNMPRSRDIENNVVAVGAVLAQKLVSNGIPTVHCQIMHDEQSYLEAYTKAKETILYYISKYPSIKYVFDIHRDAIINSNNEVIKGTADISGMPTAQIMFVVGTNENGADHPNWTTNLTVAVKAQYRLNQKYANIARPINLRGPSFNEQYTPGSLLIEIGSCGNTLTEAKNAALLLGDTLSELILGKIE